MPQFIQAQGVDPIIAQMQSQFAQSRGTAEEQARLNAGQYMKDFRQDAQNAGYSLGQWAQRNEQSVKNALFSLSGNNQQITDSKFNELLNAPENFDQKQQRLLDVESSQAPNQLFSTPDQFKDVEKSVAGTAATEAKDFTFDSIRDLAKDPSLGITNMLTLGEHLIGKTFGEWSDEEKKAWSDYRVNTQDAYFDTEFNFDSDNYTLFNAIVSGVPTKVERKVQPTSRNDIQSVNLQEDQKKSLQNILSDNSNFFKTVTGKANQIPDEAFNNSNFKEGMRQAGLDALSMGRIERNSPLQNLTKEQFSSLFGTGQASSFRGGLEIQQVQLPDLFFKEKKGTPDSTIVVSELVKKGTPGFIELKKNVLERVLEEGGALSQPELEGIRQAQEMAEADILKARTDSDRNRALNNLYEAQTAQAFAELDDEGQPNISKMANDLFTVEIKEFNDRYNAETLEKMSTSELQIYNNDLAKLKTVARSAGWNMQTKPATSGLGSFARNREYSAITGFSPASGDLNSSEAMLSQILKELQIQ